MLGFAAAAAFGQDGRAEVEPDASSSALSAEIFAAVEDRTPGVRPEERGALYEVLAAARQIPFTEQLDVARDLLKERIAERRAVPGAAEDEFSLYRDLLRRPDEYRGTLVAFDGRLRRIERRQAEANERGIDDYYEARVSPSGPDAAPVIIYLAELPEGFPEGAGLAEPVSLAGYVFKLQSFEEEGAERVAPVVVAQTLQWRPPVAGDAVTLNPNLWADVRDRQPELERDLYYFLLRQAQKIGYERQQNAAAQFVAARRDAYLRKPGNKGRTYSLFIDMFQNPEAFRGELVTITGHVRRLASYPAGENDYGIEQLHELWLFPPDSQSHPVVVVSTSIPDDLPTPSETEPVDQVTVTGYFFKNYVYTAEDAARVAPMVMAQRVEWTPVVVAGVPEWVKWAGVGLGALLILAIAALIVRSTRRDRAFRARRREKGTDVGAAGFGHPLHGGAADATGIGGVSPTGIDPHERG